MHQIVFYRMANGSEPVKEYIEELQSKAATNKQIRVRVGKIYEYLEALKAYGTRIGMPYIRHIEGDIWELRPTSDRIFFFCYSGDTFVLLHHFHKKTQKTPQREIEQAMRNRRDFINRS